MFPVLQMKTRERLREVNGLGAEPGLNPRWVSAGVIGWKVGLLFSETDDEVEAFGSEASLAVGLGCEFVMCLVLTCT